MMHNLQIYKFTNLQIEHLYGSENKTHPRTRLGIPYCPRNAHLQLRKEHQEEMMRRKRLMMQMMDCWIVVALTRLLFCLTAIDSTMLTTICEAEQQARQRTTIAARQTTIKNRPSGRFFLHNSKKSCTFVALLQNSKNKHYV